MKRLTTLCLFVLPLMVIALALTFLPDNAVQAKYLGDLEFTLDSTYGGQGVADQPALTGIKDMVRLSDGSLLGVGNGSLDSSSTLIRVAKFTPAGLPDMSFGVEGVASGSLPFASITAVALATDSQNRIVVLVGRNDTEATNVALLRFLANGDVDTTFGTAGIVVFETSIYQARGTDVAVLADNRVLVLVGGMFTRLYGFTALGELDATFATNGALSAPSGVLWRKILVDSENRIVVAGATSDVGFMTLWCYTASGSPDTSFGNSGQSSPLFEEISMGYDVVQSTMERYVVSGARQGPFKADGYAVARVSATGQLDTTFSGDGRWSYDFDPTSHMDDTIAERVFVDNVGTITIAGSKSRQPRLVQLFSDGSINTAFGVNGITESLWSGFQLRTESEVGGGLVGDTAGGLYVGGILNRAGIQKLNASGQLDFSFGTKGWTVFGSVRNVKVSATTQQPDGKTVLAFSVNGSASRYVTRLLADGKPDLAFGTAGVVILPPTDTHLDERICSRSSQANCTQVEVDPQGRILILIDSTLVRLLANGAVDTTFATDGVWQLPFGTFEFATVPRFGIQNTSHIVISGPFTQATLEYTKVIRLLPSGMADSAFGTNGVTLLDSCIDSGNRGLLTIQPDDKIIHNEFDCRYTNPLIPVHRLTADGQPDLTFGTDGTSSLPPIALGSEVLANGKILFFGMTSISGEDHVAVMQVNPNGTLDSTFGTEGTQYIPLPEDAYEGTVSHLVLDPHDGILLLGIHNFVTPVNNRPFALRLYTDGSVDSSFGVNGFQVLPIPYNAISITGAGYVGTRLVISYLAVASAQSSYETAFVAGLRYTSDAPPPTATATVTPTLPTSTPTSGTVTPTPVTTTPMPATVTPIPATATPIVPTSTPPSSTVTPTVPPLSSLFLPMVRRN